MRKRIIRKKLAVFIQLITNLYDKMSEKVKNDIYGKFTILQALEIHLPFVFK